MKNANPRPQPVYLEVDTPSDRLGRRILYAICLAPLLYFIMLVLLFCVTAHHPEKTETTTGPYRSLEEISVPVRRAELVNPPSN